MRGKINIFRGSLVTVCYYYYQLLSNDDSVEFVFGAQSAQTHLEDLTEIQRHFGFGRVVVCKMCCQHQTQIWKSIIFNYILQQGSLTPLTSNVSFSVED